MLQKYYSKRAARLAFLLGRTVFLYSGPASWQFIGVQRQRLGHGCKYYSKLFNRLVKSEKPLYYTIRE